MLQAGEFLGFLWAWLRAWLTILWVNAQGLLRRPVLALVGKDNIASTPGNVQTAVLIPANRSPIDRVYSDPTWAWEVKRVRLYVATYVAHAKMLLKQKIVDEKAASAMMGGLHAIYLAGPELFNMVPVKDTIPLTLENHLATLIGAEYAKRLPTGLSRIDLIATVVKLNFRRQYLDVLDAVNTLQGKLLLFSKKHSDTLMSYHTHMQQSQPGTVGHFVLAYLYRFQTLQDRAQELLKHFNKSPLGTAGRVGTTWPNDMNFMSTLLGFDAPVPHSLLGRDYEWSISVSGLLSEMMTLMSDLGTDIQLFGTNEFDAFSLGPNHIIASSIFPQKRNMMTPDRLRVAGGAAILWPSTLQTIARGMGTGDHYIRQATRLFDWASEVIETCVLAGEIIDDLNVNSSALKAHLDKSWSTATSVTDCFAEHEEFGIPYRQGYEVVKWLVNDCKEHNIARSEVTGEMMNRAVKQVTGRDLVGDVNVLMAALDPARFVESCVSKGSVGKAALISMFAECDTTLAANNSWITGTRFLTEGPIEKLLSDAAQHNTYAFSKN